MNPRTSAASNSGVSGKQRARAIDDAVIDGAIGHLKRKADVLDLLLGQLSADVPLVTLDRQLHGLPPAGAKGLPKSRVGCALEQHGTPEILVAQQMMIGTQDRVGGIVGTRLQGRKALGALQPSLLEPRGGKGFQQRFLIGEARIKGADGTARRLDDVVDGDVLPGMRLQLLPGRRNQRIPGFATAHLLGGQR